MPKPYLKLIFENNITIQDAVFRIREITRYIDKEFWSMEERSIKEKLYRIAGVPPIYCSLDKPVPNAKTECMKVYQSICKNVCKFVRSPHLLYFHSNMESSSLLAVSNIVKSAVDSGVSAFMIDFPTYIEDVAKAFEDKNRDVVKKLEESDLVVVYFVGKEFKKKESDFNTVNLFSLIAKRRVKGKPTVISSHLKLVEFEKVYGKVDCIEVEFKDDTVTKTLRDLLSELEIED